MQITTIEIGGTARYVIRPVDNKALNRFLTRARTWLLRDDSLSTISCRPSDPAEIERWKSAFALHTVWGGDEEQFFGIPL